MPPFLGQILTDLQNWIGPSAVAIITFFAVRYISKRDEFETDIEKKFERHTEAFHKKLQVHADSVNQSAAKFQNAVLEVKKEASEMRKSNLDFQAIVSEKLNQIESQTVRVQATLERTAEKANELEAKVDHTLKKVGEVADKVQYHDQLVGELAKHYVDSKRRIEENTAATVRIGKQIETLKARKGKKN